MRHARSIVRRVCDIAGQVTWIDDLRYDAIETGLIAAVEDHDTAAIFDWLMRLSAFVLSMVRKKRGVKSASVYQKHRHEYGRHS